MPSVLESNCQPPTKASRLSPTQPFSERLPTYAVGCYALPKGAVVSN
ncbi:MAG: hypothetical protein LBK82_12835 [Planctomycetaceae bacterium]|nr:hypothetical protein [Planctomycetaceae bacterium]